MQRIVKNKLEQRLIDSMIKVHSLLRESFMTRKKASFKVEVPEFKYSDLTHYNELNLALECLKWNYRELLRYLKNENYSPLLKVVFLYNYENCVPVPLNITIEQFLESDLFVGKEILNIKKF
ncbi:hypothetical protein [Fusobacterium sp.]|uniref:hypothetical protein n=1 Tax=Fusobacterium sp. TaxID=68766 RepID=UPI0028FF123D|nr:hypothetical protein [Fusobacterium sp.]MDU1912124.1 hypothetical protein [Fusobacterium sp.]